MTTFRDTRVRVRYLVLAVRSVDCCTWNVMNWFHDEEIEGRIFISDEDFERRCDALRRNDPTHSFYNLALRKERKCSGHCL
jgi:hypothetical protein